jgi:hypothetical protein
MSLPFDAVLRPKGAPDDQRRYVVVMKPRGKLGTYVLRDKDGRLLYLSAGAVDALLEVAA